MQTIELIPTTATKLKRIAELSASDENKVFHNVMHLFNSESLNICYRELDGRKALGTDGITKEQYGQALNQNLEALIERMKRMAYRPGAIREVRIPKAGQAEAYRQLGISNFEDKLVQKMMHKVLESIYEPLFLPCNYGFRPGKSCHDVIKALHEHLYKEEVQTIIDVDLANYFNTIDQQALVKLLEEKIKDKRFVRYIVRQFKAGILRNNELMVSEEGVVQGSMVSPVLANIYAHFVIDKWFEEDVKPRCIGQVKLFRYCDDIRISCQYDQDAQRIKRVLSKRLTKYGLSLNEDKTRMVSFSKKSKAKGIKQGAFEFLGFTFYLGESKYGNIIPKVKTSGQRMKAKLKRVKEWAREQVQRQRLRPLWKIFCLKLEGHVRYFGITLNSRKVEAFLNQAVRVLFKWLNRRSQRKSFNWEQFQLFLKLNPRPVVKVYHKLF